MRRTLRTFFNTFAFGSALVCGLLSLPTYGGEDILRWHEGWRPQLVSIKAGETYLSSRHTRLQLADPSGLASNRLFRLYNESRPMSQLLLGDVVMLQDSAGRFYSLQDQDFTALTRQKAAHFMVAAPTGLFRLFDPLPPGGIALRQVSPPDGYLPTQPIPPIDSPLRLPITMDSRLALTVTATGEVKLNRSGTALTLKPEVTTEVQLAMGERVVHVNPTGPNRDVLLGDAPGNRSRVFTLYNLSRPSNRPLQNDVIALQASTGYFLTMGGGLTDPIRSTATITASSPYADENARFTITYRDTIFGDSVPQEIIILRPYRADRGNIYATPTGIAYRRDPVAGETAFTIRSLAEAPLTFSALSDGTDLPATRPLAIKPTPEPREVRVTVVALNKPGMAPYPDSAEVTQQKFAGDGAFSVKKFVEANTGGNITVSWGGLFGPYSTDAVSPNGNKIAELLTPDRARFMALANERGEVGAPDVMLYVADTNNEGNPANYGPVNINHNGFRICCNWIAWANPVDRPVGENVGVAAHESSHLLWNQNDTYGYRTPLQGAGIAYQYSGAAHSVYFDEIGRPRRVNWREEFYLERVGGGSTLSSGDAIRLKMRAAPGSKGKYGPYLRPIPSHVVMDGQQPFPGTLDMSDSVPTDQNLFRLSKVRGSAGLAIQRGDIVMLQATDDKDPQVLGVEQGGFNPVYLKKRSTWKRQTWAEFRLDAATELLVGNRIALVSNAGRGHIVHVNPAVRTKLVGNDASRADALNRGYIWDGVQGAGVGGKHENSSEHKTNLISAYDRISRGWGDYRYVTPSTKGCFTMQPFLDRREVTILFDPVNPTHWYTVELRKNTPGTDEVESGFIVSWINTSLPYWRESFRRVGDRRDDLYISIVPVLLSGTAIGQPPNMLHRPLTYYSNAVMKYDQPGVSFRNPSQRIVLPLGDGLPSAFELSFNYPEGDPDIGTFCVH